MMQGTQTILSRLYLLEFGITTLAKRGRVTAIDAHHKFARLPPSRSTRRATPTMLALRRLPRFAPRLASVRGNATLEAAAHSQADAASPPPSSVTAKSSGATGNGAGSPGEHQQNVKGRKKATQTQAPREWCRPIAKGVEPAYDYALRYIVKDATFMRQELEQLRAAAAVEAKKSEGERDEAALRGMHEQIRILEIQSQANLPDVRWKARNGLGKYFLMCLCVLPLNYA